MDVIWKKKKRDLRGQFAFCPITQSRYIPLIKGFFFFGSISKLHGQKGYVNIYIYIYIFFFEKKKDMLIREVIESIILDRIKWRKTIHVAKILQVHVIAPPEKQTITICDGSISLTPTYH